MESIMATPKAFLKSKGVKNPDIVIWSVGAIIVIIIGYTIYKKIRAKSLVLFNNPAQTQSDLNKQLGDLNISAKNLTITSDQATIIAQNLLNAMNRWGTDDQAVIENISLAKTREDLELIVQKFGILPYDGFGLSDTFLSNLVGAVMKNLPAWIRSEMSGDNLQTVKNMFDKLGVPF